MMQLMTSWNKGLGIKNRSLRVQIGYINYIFRNSSAHNDPDSTWMTILELNGNLPKPKRKETIVDIYLRQKNASQLKAAMYQSYHQYQGYLPPKDVVQLALAYSTVYYLGLDQGGIRGAINWARSQDIKMGMVNIDKFIMAAMDKC